MPRLWSATGPQHPSPRRRRTCARRGRSPLGASPGRPRKLPCAIAWPEEARCNGTRGWKASLESTESRSRPRSALAPNALSS
eukprot:3464453-Alexandrium_andersonii.AAC.1